MLPVLFCVCGCHAADGIRWWDMSVVSSLGRYALTGYACGDNAGEGMLANFLQLTYTQ